jgi:hypothetical protein
MTRSRSDPIELFRKLLGQGFGRREAPFEDPVGDVSIAQSHDRCAKDGYSRGRQNEPGGERAFANAARRPIVVRIDGDDPCHARILARRQHQRDRSADRDADDCRLPNIDLVEVRRGPLVEILGRVCGFRNVRPAVPGIVKGMDREVFRELRNDFLEHVELGSERMQENEVRTHPGLDATDSYATEVYIFDGNPGGPDQEVYRLKRLGFNKVQVIEDLQLREQPDPRARNILGAPPDDRMPKGSQVALIDICRTWMGSGRGAQDADNIWCPVLYEGHRGWANAYYLAGHHGERVACVLYPPARGCASMPGR